MKTERVPYCVCAEWGEWHGGSACCRLRFIQQVRDVRVEGKKGFFLEIKKKIYI